MINNKRQILVTTALPYANGPLHLGHILEQIQADIWVRFQRLKGHKCLFICADDSHGTPIMISASKEGITPQQLITKINEQHQSDAKEFLINFDNYYTTHSPENRHLVEEIYKHLYDKKDIITKTIEQAYDPIENMFLPDRYVKGDCPKCNAQDQYGDNCEVCGATYLATELKNPISTISGVTPITKTSEHYFFNLTNYHQQLKEWTTTANHLQEQVANKMQEWFQQGLQPWDISRDAPYFGFLIPNTKDKYFYVWLDAPIGYMASFKNLCDKHNISFDEYWQKNSKTELYHFVGKDIIYFHALFWPAMLMGAGLRTPTAIWAHGFLTINDQKMSKSRKTFITARQYLNSLDPEYLRYYFAAKLHNRIDDIDLNLDDFMQRVNADLVGKVINIASRCASFIDKHFSGYLSQKLEEPELYAKFTAAGDIIADYFEKRDYHRAVREIMNIADLANQYINDKKPWSLAKQDNLLPQVQEICSMGINLFRVIMIYLQPILPNTALKVQEFLNTNLNWQDKDLPLLDHKINPFIPLMQRLTKENLANLTIGA